jgi:hypothetical protein
MLQVLWYLKAFANHYHLLELVRFNTCVMSVAPVSSTASIAEASVAAKPAKHTSSAGNSAVSSTDQQSAAQQPSPSPDVPWTRWNVTWLGRTDPTGNGICCPGPVPSVMPGPAAGARDTRVMQSEVFDAVLVCNGHYTEPHLPDIPGGSDFPGLLMHSHNYRRADPFKGQRVAIIGASYSGGLACQSLACATDSSCHGFRHGMCPTPSLCCARVWMIIAVLPGSLCTAWMSHAVNVVPQYTTPVTFPVCHVEPWCRAGHSPPCGSAGSCCVCVCA